MARFAAFPTVVVGTDQVTGLDAKITEYDGLQGNIDAVDALADQGIADAATAQAAADAAQADATTGIANAATAQAAIDTATSIAYPAVDATIAAPDEFKTLKVKLKTSFTGAPDANLTVGTYGGVASTTFAKYTLADATLAGLKVSIDFVSGDYPARIYTYNWMNGAVGAEVDDASEVNFFDMPTLLEGVDLVSVNDGIGGFVWELERAAGNLIQTIETSQVVDLDTQLASKTSTQPSIQSMLDNAPQTDGHTIIVDSYVTDTGYGGGVFVYDASRVRSTSDGGHVFDPTIAADPMLQIAGANGTTGCFVRQANVIDVQQFGAIPDGVVTLDGNDVYYPNVTGRSGTDNSDAFEAADTLAYTHITGGGLYTLIGKVVIPPGRYHLSRAWQSNTHYEGTGAIVDNTVVHSTYTERNRHGLTVQYSPSDGFGIYRTQRSLTSGLRAHYCNGDGFRILPAANAYGLTLSPVSANSGTIQSCSAVGNVGHGWYLDGSGSNHINSNLFVGCASRQNGGDGIQAVGDVSYNTFNAFEAEANTGWTVYFDDSTRTVTFTGGYLKSSTLIGTNVARFSANHGTGQSTMWGTELDGRVLNLFQGTYRDTAGNKNVIVSGGKAGRVRTSVDLSNISTTTTNSTTGPHSITYDLWDMLSGYNITSIDNVHCYGQRSTTNSAGVSQMFFFKMGGVVGKENTTYDATINKKWVASTDYDTGDRFIQIKDADSLGGVFEVAAGLTSGATWDATEEARYTYIGQVPDLFIDYDVYSLFDCTISSVAINVLGKLTITFNTTHVVNAPSYVMGQCDVTRDKGFI